MKKRIFSILLCLCMVLMLCPMTALAEEPPSAINGDLNGDGQVNTYDATLLQNYLEGLVSFTDEQLAAADFNGDGEVNYSDWIALQSYLISQSCLVLQDITVENGKATACGTEISKAANGTRVTLTADSPSDNMVFDKWIVNEGNVTLADASSATTTFTMPDDDVSVTAKYKLLSAGETGSLAITVNGFQVGKTPNDCTYTFASTIPDITFSADDIKSIGWHRYAANGSYFPVTNDDAFRAGTLYRCVIDLDSNDLTEVPVVTVNGNTPDFRTFQYSAGAPVKLSIGCDLGTPAEPVLAITVNGFQVGNTPKDITFSFASTIPGVEFSAYDIKFIRWEQCIVGEMGNDAWYNIPHDEVFQADTRYKCCIYLDNKGLKEAPAVTVNGKTPGDCEIATIDGVPHELRIGCELGTPEPILTLTVPFTATVKLGGSTAPGETTFELALIDGSGNKLKYDGMYFDAVVTTDGAGSYTGTMTLTGPFQQLWNMLCEGAFVKQVDGGEEGWTYDDTVWGLLLKEAVALVSTDDAAPEYTVLIYPTYIKDDGSFAPNLNADPVDRMSFINTYTYSYSAPVRDTATIIIGGEKEESKPVEENPNTGAPVAANMSTLSVLVLAASAVAVLKTRKR